MIPTLLLLSSLLGSAEGIELLGSPAKAWPELSWIQSEPLRLEKLQGKVVLLRFWTEGCPLCEQTAPALNDLWKEYKDKGLVVLGFFHPKPPREISKEEVAKAAKKLKFEFPIAIDADWKTLKSWWLTRERAFTSSSFLLDKKGVIRWIHPGGEFHASPDPEHAECQKSYKQLREEIEKLLHADPPPPARR